MKKALLLVSTLTKRRNFTPVGTRVTVWGPNNWIFFLTKFRYINASHAHISSDFNIIFSNLGLFIIIWVDSLKGLWGFELKGVQLSPNLQHPLVAKLYIGSDFCRCRTCSRSSITMPSLVEFARDDKNIKYFLFLFVCLSVALLKGKV